jgi:hypothetical protein
MTKSEASTMTETEAELFRVTKLKERDGEPRSKLLARLAKAVLAATFPDESWKGLSDCAQRWANWSAFNLKNKRPPCEFDAIPEGDPSDAQDNPDEADVEEEEPVAVQEGRQDEQESLPFAEPKNGEKAPQEKPGKKPKKLKPVPQETETVVPPAPKGKAKNVKWSSDGASAYWRKLCILGWPSATKAELDSAMDVEKLVLAPGSKSVIRHEVKRVMELLASEGLLKKPAKPDVA